MSNLLKAATAVHQDSHDFHRAIRDDYAIVKWRLQLRFDWDSTADRFPFDCNSTALPTILRYGLPVLGCCISR